MSEPRVPLYERIPAIYRIKDAEQNPPDQLKNYLGLVEEVFGSIHKNIEALYHDLFIETCDDWVIPYIGDLLGVSHLDGDPWTLRADVADTILLRRRKGTLNAIQLLAFDLTQWPAHCVELRENMVWNQHLNHQRPDEGGVPPYSLPEVTRHTVIRGGTVTLRDPAMMTLLNTPFDRFAHTADLKPPALGNIRYNLPNLAIFLWRLQDYRIPISKPFFRDKLTLSDSDANFAVRFDIHPLGQPLRLFNTYRFDPGAQPPEISEIDQMPNPIPAARLNTNSPAGNPEAYVTVSTYAAADLPELSDTGLQFHLPEDLFAGNEWGIRGANLCAWEDGINPPLEDREIVIDPKIGRVVFGVGTEDEANALIENLFITYTYGAVGPVGAHPISRGSVPVEWNGERVTIVDINYHDNQNALQQALENIDPNSDVPIAIQINDSMVHDIDLSLIPGILVEDGGPNLLINRTLIIRAADSQRPMIRLAQPLRFRPTNIVGVDEDQQDEFDAVMDHLTVRLEGLYLTRGESFVSGEPLIARTALHSLEVIGCTLDPGGSLELDGSPNGIRTAMQPAMNLKDLYGFSEGSDEEVAFDQTPEIIIQRSICGSLFIDTGYLLFLDDSIIDAGKGVGDVPEDKYAVSGAGDPATTWGPQTQVTNTTFFGRMRVEEINGRGNIWIHSLEVFQNQKGCIKFSYFFGNGDRLPQNHACVTGQEAHLSFTSEIFGQPAYGQLALGSDFRILERGSGDDRMGTFNFLLEAHKWRNLQIRFREFMPVGIRPLLIPVT